ncbi:hypothetical protein [Legionella hackeliae]|uniref:Uncharacterized protein n=1 Tax=Legionella hackeliae TaxID=449 RepID=A0A0A8ULB1_LEGHA|nr:hypothetical protein [Legionella hackeliae]KTD14856.1 hypothetical protein Lhac_0386 [Legionella hackeliae]CEK09518.1 conserved exported protein of unknown function [Legionella hackeliae]STX49425.1 Uncharacterised protein [Legionella hackeliae]
MTNKNIGIATMVIVILVAIMAFFYYHHVSTPVAKSIDSTPDIPAEVPEPNPVNPDQ